ncbi:MAG: hypothetical protein H6733_07015 [Alphaproteobacteria bacterium]|nr:hypothetical protein [Alphaproteobacteria bacterium]
MRTLLPVLVFLAACGGSTVDASLLTEGTLAVERLPDAVVLDDELPAPGVTATEVEAAITTALDDALQNLDYATILGTVPVSALPATVVLADDPALGGVAGDVLPDYSDVVTLADTSAVELASVTVGPAVHGVTFTAQTTIEKPGSTTGRYEFTLRAESCAGTAVGFAMWRPGTVTQSYNADSVSVVGFATDVDVATTYVFCGRKFDGSAPDASVGPRGLIAHW